MTYKYAKNVYLDNFGILKCMYLHCFVLYFNCHFLTIFQGSNMDLKQTETTSNRPGKYKATCNSLFVITGVKTSTTSGAVIIWLFLCIVWLFLVFMFTTYSIHDAYDW